jgi:hypothetical protein
MDYTAQNSYSDKIYEQRCHGLKQYGNIIREYFGIVFYLVLFSDIIA